MENTVIHNVVTEDGAILKTFTGIFEAHEWLESQEYIDVAGFWLKGREAVRIITEFGY